VYKLAVNKLSATGLWGEARAMHGALQSLAGSASRHTNAHPTSSLSDTDISVGAARVGARSTAHLNVCKSNSDLHDGAALMMMPFI